MVVTFATSATIACGDAAVDPVTAPKLAAMPAAPVAGQWPLATEITANGIPTSALGLQIFANPRFEDDYKTFVVDARVTFQWSNQVSANLEAWLLNSTGQTVNKGQAGMSYNRLALPVPQGDTTFTVRIYTNNITCGLVGKSSYGGTAAMVALDARLFTITLISQTIQTTTAQDVLQPACPPPTLPPGCELEPVSRLTTGSTGVIAATEGYCAPPLLPPVEGSEEFEVCLSVWREYWVYDFISDTFSLLASWFIGMLCYFTTIMS